MKRKTLSSLLCLFLVCALLSSLCMSVMATDGITAEPEDVTAQETPEAPPAEEPPAEEPPAEEPPAEDPPAEEEPAGTDQGGTEVDVDKPGWGKGGKYQSMDEAREAIRLGIETTAWSSCYCFDMNDGSLVVYMNAAYPGERVGDFVTVIDFELREIILNGISVPFTTDGYYATVSADVVADAATRSETGAINVEIVVYGCNGIETWVADFVSVQPEEPAIVVNINIAASEYIDKETPVAYVDDGLTVDYTVEGDLTPTTIYLNGVAVPFTFQVTDATEEAATMHGGTDGGAAANGRKTSQGGRIVLNSQTLAQYGKVDEINTLDVVFSVGGSEGKTVQASPLRFMLKEKVVTNKTDDKSKDPKTDKKETTNTPDTGDTFHPVLWIVLMVVSAVGLVAVNLYRRKKHIRYFG